MDGYKLPGNVSQEGMMQQAQHIWTMLDDMAQNNPQAYKTFIDKQMTEGKAAMKKPEAHMCVQTSIQESQNRRMNLFINVFEWIRIPTAKDDTAPIPVLGGPLYQLSDDSGPCQCVTVAFNPDVLKEFGRDSNLVEERRMLVSLAIDYLQDQHKLQISRNYCLLNKDHPCKGPVSKAQETLMKKLSKQDDKFEQQLGDLEKSFGPLAQGCSDSLIDQLSNITLSADTNSQSNTSNVIPGEVSDQSELRLPGQQSGSKKGLVEEVSTNGSKLPEPEYELTIKNPSSPQACIVVKIRLPGVMSVQDCQLDISQDDVHLVVDDQYELQLSLPRRVAESESSAKFSKKSTALTLNLPVETETR